MFSEWELSATVLPIRNQTWFEIMPFALVLIFLHLGLLIWETRYVSATLKYPGLKRVKDKSVKESRLGAVLKVKILALEFPPVSHLFEWPDFAFEGTPLAMNKTVLVYLFAFALTLGLFLLAGSKKGLVPRGISMSLKVESISLKTA